jgi:hypothetical protein
MLPTDSIFFWPDNFRRGTGDQGRFLVPIRAGERLSLNGGTRIVATSHSSMVSPGGTISTCTKVRTFEITDDKIFPRRRVTPSRLH